MDYKQTQLGEILWLIKRGFSYSDVRSMPIFIRRYYIQHINDKEKGN